MTASPLPSSTISPVRVPGELGMWIFLLGDMCIFAVIFGSFAHDRAADLELFRASQAALDRNLGALNTLLLLTSSWFVALGVRAAHRRLDRLVPRLFALGFACGLGFAVVKLFEYRDKLAAGLTPVTNDFFMYYFVATGIHFLHLLIGLGLLAFLAAHSRPASAEGPSLAWIEGGACYWHMVDLLWIILFPLLYLTR
jgi:nitric oxide reductase NorE protein